MTNKKARAEKSALVIVLSLNVLSACNRCPMTGQNEASFVQREVAFSLENDGGIDQPACCPMTGQQ